MIDAADSHAALPPALPVPQALGNPVAGRDRLSNRGIDVARRFFAAVTLRPGRSYRTVPTRANRQPALGTYMADPHTGVYRAYGLLVVTIADDRIAAVTGFGASVMPRFGLPRTLPGTD